jgi:transposase
VFLGPDTVCFVMDPTRAGSVLARHAPGIDEDTGQLTAGGGGSRQLMISSDFYSAYISAGKKPDGLVNLFAGPTRAGTSSAQGTRTRPS